MAEDILSSMEQKNIISLEEQVEIKELVLLHALLHKEIDEEELLERFENRKSFYIHLVQLCRCDSLGRFCVDNNFSDERYSNFLSYAEGYK